MVESSPPTGHFSLRARSRSEPIHALKMKSPHFLRNLVNSLSKAHGPPDIIPTRRLCFTWFSPKDRIRATVVPPLLHFLSASPTFFALFSVLSPEIPFCPGVISAMNCPFCGSTKVRNSRFRATDIPNSLLLRFPVRCRDCEERIHVSLARAREIRRASEARRLERNVPGTTRGSSEGRP